MAVTFARRFDSPKKAAIPAMSQMSSSSKPWDFSTSKSASPTVSAERIVDCHLVGDQRVLGPDTQDRPVGDDAILIRRIAPWAMTQYWHWFAFEVATTIISPLGLGQVSRLLHQRVVVGEEGPELVPAGGRARERHSG